MRLFELFWEVLGFGRCDHHYHLTTFHFGHVFHLRVVFEISGHTLQQLAPQLQVGHFPTAEPQRYFDLIAFFEKLSDRAHLDIIVMRVRVGTELDLFDLDDFLLFPGLRLALLLFIFELAKIHDLTDRWVGIGRYFNQIEASFIGKFHAFGGGHDTYVFAVGANKSDFI